jgi:hypothetical protein
MGEQSVRMTIEISDELFRKAKAAAASRGETLREFVSAAIETRLASMSLPTSDGGGWRSVFGLADPKAVARVDAVIESEFEQVDPSDWR